MAQVTIKAIPDDGDHKVLWVTGDRIFFSLIRQNKGTVLGVWYPCLGDWDRTPEGTIAR